MDLFDGDRKGYLVGAIAGLAAAAVVREFRGGFRDLGRPLAKATIKSCLALADRGRELFAHLGEVVEDLTIEARLELDEQYGAVAAAETHDGPASGGPPRPEEAH